MSTLSSLCTHQAPARKLMCGEVSRIPLSTLILSRWPVPSPDLIWFMVSWMSEQVKKPEMQGVCNSRGWKGLHEETWMPEVWAPGGANRTVNLLLWTREKFCSKWSYGANYDNQIQLGGEKAVYALAISLRAVWKSRYDQPPTWCHRFYQQLKMLPSGWFKTRTLVAKSFYPAPGLELCQARPSNTVLGT